MFNFGKKANMSYSVDPVTWGLCCVHTRSSTVYILYGAYDSRSVAGERIVVFAGVIFKSSATQI